MNDANLDFIVVGGRRYGVDLLNPLEGLEWGMRAASLFGPALGKIVGEADLSKFEDMDLERMSLAEAGERFAGLLAAVLSSCGTVNSREAAALLGEAVRRCYTPRNEALRNEAVFNAHFREHPGDLYELGGRALFRLVRDFFPNPPAIGKAAFLTRTDTQTGRASASRPDGKDTPSPAG